MELEIAVHLRPKHLVRGVRQLKSDARGAALRVEARRDVAHPRGEDRVGIVREGDLRFLTNMHEGELVLVDVPVDPDRREVGDLVEGHPWLDGVALEGHLLDHDAGDRGVDRLIQLRLAGPLEGAKLCVAQVPSTQPLAACAKK